VPTIDLMLCAFLSPANADKTALHGLIMHMRKQNFNMFSHMRIQTLERGHLYQECDLQDAISFA
jgi:hypothetical protein